MIFLPLFLPVLFLPVLFLPCPLSPCPLSPCPLSPCPLSPCPSFSLPLFLTVLFHPSPFPLRRSLPGRRPFLIGLRALRALLEVGLHSRA